jgi:hypothetical protein
MELIEWGGGRKPGREATNEDRERLGVKRGNGTMVRVDLDPHQKVPRLETLKRDDETDKIVTATCTGGGVAIGGGFRISNVSNAGEVVITGSYPSAADTWTATGNIDTNTGDVSFSLHAYVICADTP